VPTGAVDHEAQHLLEKFEYRYCLFVFADRSEKPLNYRLNSDAVKIGNEKAQTSSAREPFAGRFDTIYFQFLFTVNSAILVHRVPHLFGIALLIITVVGFSKHYSILSIGVGLFLFVNRSA
jgi:hypothetical protein